MRPRRTSPEKLKALKLKRDDGDDRPVSEPEESPAVAADDNRTEEGQKCGRSVGRRSPKTSNHHPPASFQSDTAVRAVEVQGSSTATPEAIAVNRSMTPEKLRQIERGEEALHALGFRVCRVRHHDSMASVEVAGEDLRRALDPDMYETIVRELRAAGYESVTIDPRGYRTGSLNEGLLLRQV